MFHVNLPLDSVTASPNGIIVKETDGNIAQATQSDFSKLPFLPIKTRRVHLFDTLASGSIIPLGTICDSGCTEYFSSRNVYILFQGRIVLQGVRSASTTFMWKLRRRKYIKSKALSAFLPGNKRLINKDNDNDTETMDTSLYGEYYMSHTSPDGLLKKR